MPHLFHHLALCVCVLAVFLAACSDEPNNSKLLNAPTTTHFYAKWVNDDSLEIFYSFGPFGTLPGTEPLITAARIYQSSSPNGPWAEVDRTEPNSYQYEHTSKIHSQLSSGLTFFRIDYDIVTAGEKRLFRGPIITTSKPLQHPRAWEIGTTLKATEDVYIYDGGSSCISKDYSEIFAPLGKGLFFNIASGVVRNGVRRYDPSENVALQWIDTLLIFSGSYLYIVSQNVPDKQIFGMVAAFSYRQDDTSYLYYRDNLIYRYRLTSKTFVRDSSVIVPAYEIAKTVSSPSYKYIACISSFWNTAGSSGGWRLLNANSQPLAALYPFEDYRDEVEFFKLREPVWDKTPLYIQWGSDDDRVYFWADWSGCMEIWTYSISQKSYDQITGYTRGQYPGTYYEMNSTWLDTEIPSDRTNHHSTRVNTINFLYHPGKKKLMLFFRQGERNFAVRYADLPQ